MRLADHAAVQGVCQLAGYFIGAANQLRNYRSGEIWVTRIFTLWAVRQEEVLIALHAGGIKNWTHLIARGAWVGGAFKDDELSLAEHLGNQLGGVKNERKIWLLVVTQRCGHADQDGVGLLQIHWIRGSQEPRAGLDVIKEVLPKVVDVRLARLDVVNLALVDVKAHYLEARLQTGVREWKSNVAEANNAHGGGLGFDLLEQFGSDGVHGYFQSRFSRLKCCLKISRPYSSAKNLAEISNSHKIFGILQQPNHRIQEAGALCPVHHAVIATEGQWKREASIETTIFHHDALFRAPGGQDGDFGVVNDRRSKHAAITTDVGDGERATHRLFALDGSILARTGKTLDLIGKFNGRLLLCVLDHRDHEARVGIDRAAQVHWTLDQNLTIGIISDGIERWVLLQRLANRGHDERQHAQLLPSDAAVFLALLVKLSDVCFVNNREVHCGPHTAIKALGDLATHAAEWHALGDTVLINEHRSCCDCRGTGRKSSTWGRARRWSAVTVTGKGLNVRGRHAPTTTTAGNALNVDAKFTRDATHRRCCQRLALTGNHSHFRSATRKAVAHGQRSTHGSNHGSLIIRRRRCASRYLRRYARRGGLGTAIATCTRRGLRGRTARTARTWRALRRRTDRHVPHQHRADFDDVASLATDLCQRAGPWRGNLNQCLIRLHLSERLALLDGVTGLDLPVDEFCLSEALTQVRKEEVALVARLLDSGHRCSLCYSVSTP